MNIFVLDTDIKKCAEYHNDKHVVKMITESTQILSTVLRLEFPGINIGYKSTHIHHPCVIWARESIQNWIWLRDLTIALNNEYRYRYNKEINHKAYDIAMTLSVPGSLPNTGLTPFRLAMPDKYKSEDAVESYRKYYIGEKRHIANWKNRQIPEWWE